MQTFPAPRKEAAEREQFVIHLPLSLLVCFLDTKPQDFRKVFQEGTYRSCSAGASALLFPVSLP